LSSFFLKNSIFCILSLQDKDQKKAIAEKDENFFREPD